MFVCDIECGRTKKITLFQTPLFPVSVCLAQQCLSEETVTQQRAGSVESEQLTAGPDLQEAEVGGVSGCSSTRAGTDCIKTDPV